MPYTRTAQGTKSVFLIITFRNGSNVMNFAPLQNQYPFQRHTLAPFPTPSTCPIYLNTVFYKMACLLHTGHIYRSEL